MATFEENKARFQEIANRGIQDRLDPDKRARFDEAVKRGLITVEAANEPQQAPDQQDTFLQDAADVGGELAAAGNRGLLAIPDTAIDAVNTAIGGFRGIGTLATGGSLDDAVTATRQPGPIPTITESVEAVTGNVPGQGDFMDPGTARDLVQAGGEVLIPGGVGLVPSGVRNVATNAADAALEFAGIGAGKVAEPVKAVGRAVATTASDARPSVQQAKRAAELPLKRRAGDVAEAGFKLDDAGNVVRHPQAQEAIKRGFAKPTIALVQDAPPAAKRNMLRIVDRIGRGLKNQRAKITKRPSDVIGESIVNRFRVIRNANRAAGSRLDSVADSLKGQQIDANPAVNQFLSDLQNEGITVVDGKLDFDNSTIEGLKKPQAIINNLFNRMKNTRTPDAFDAHRLKRFIDNQVTFGSRKSGLSGQMENIAKNLRRNIDQTLDANFPEYDRINTIYSETIGALDEFQQLAGKKINLQGDNADSAIGTLSRRLLSNAQSRVPIKDSLSRLDAVAQKYGDGAIDLNDDIIGQVAFVDELERVFGPQAETSFLGDITKAVTRRSPTEAITAGIDELASKAFGTTDQQRLKALRDLLRN